MSFSCPVVQHQPGEDRQSKVGPASSRGTVLTHAAHLAWDRNTAEEEPQEELQPDWDRLGIIQDCWSHPETRTSRGRGDTCLDTLPHSEQLHCSLTTKTRTT